MPDNYSKLTSDRPPPPPYSEACSALFNSIPACEASASGPVPVPGPGPGPGPEQGTGPWVRPAPISIYSQSSSKQLAKICGCEPKTWTKIIATIQIIACGICFFWIVPAVCNSTTCDGDGNNIDRSNGTFNQLEDDEDEIDFNLCNGTCVILQFYEYNGDPNNQALETLMGLFFGCILFAGAHYGKPVLILIWMIVQGFVIGILSIAVLALIFLLIQGGGILAVVLIIIVLIPTTTIFVFCFVVASRHRRELIDQEQLIGRASDSDCMLTGCKILHVAHNAHTVWHVFRRLAGS